MTFGNRHDKLEFCASGRVMVCLNEREVETVENVPVGMGENGEMEYSEQPRKQYEYDVYWLDSVDSNTEGAVLQAAVASVIAEIVVYDESPSVNSFFINGRQISWSSADPSSPNKSVRMGLRQNIADKMTRGEETITLWMGDAPITVSCKMAESLMCELENYAYECFNVTASHRSAIADLSTIEEVMSYDYCAGYPDKLNINIQVSHLGK